MKSNLSLFLLIGGLLITTSCAHYSPVQMGSGDFGNREIVRCSDKLLSMPLNAKENRIDNILSDTQLHSSDIFSIETKNWYWLFPLYYYNCTVVSLNTEGAKKYPNEAWVKGENPSANGPIKEGEFNDVKTIEDCNQFQMSFWRDRCRAALKQRSAAK